MAGITFKISSKVKNGKAEVQMRLTAGRGVARKSMTSIFVPTEFWNATTQRIEIPRRFVTPATVEATEAQDKLNRLAAFVQGRFQDLHGATINDRWLKDTIDEFWGRSNGDLTPVENYCLPYIQKQPYSKSTYHDFTQLQDELKEFGKRHHRIYIQTISVKDVEDFEKFLLRNKCQNSVNGKLKKLRAVVRWCYMNGLTAAQPFPRYKIKADVYGTPTYLTLEERDKVYECTIQSSRLACQRDVFIFQCHVGCRVSDLLALKKGNVTPDGFLQYIQQKTRTTRPNTIRVPLSDTAKKIIEKYADTEGDALLPFISAQKYNDDIKQILRIASIDRQVLILNNYTHENESKPLYMVATSHLARRTFMANMYKAVKSERIVSAFTGHSDGSKAFARYTDIDDEMKREILDNLELTR
jgi:integrase